MKKFIAAAAMLAITSVHAEELKFGDLNFFIPAGNFNLSADVDFRSDEGTVGAVTSETEGWYLGSLLTYGISNRFNIFGGLNYQFDVEVANETAPTNKPYNQDGLANPVIGGIGRLYNQNDNSMNVDFGFIGRANIEDQELGTWSGSDPVDGNAADGRSSMEFFARAGKKWNEANEWQLTAGIIQNMEGDVEQKAPASGASTESDVNSSIDTYLRAAYQYRPVNEFMIALTAQATQVGEASAEEKITGTETTLDSHLDMDFRFQAKYLVTSNFITRFTLSQSRNSDFKGDVAGTNFDIEKRRTAIMGLGVDWLF
ncbi:MAG TPA: hypothetical protein VNJ08_06665 [Bacteriovoracaceae bacterium]|nr:hypothetical protein [Bacteriovoracaceae bacterium]